MNGLQVLDLKRPGLADRLLGRRPKENAAVELNNYVADTPLPEVKRAAVEAILSRHGLNHSDAKPAFALIYAQVLRHLSQDKHISDGEQWQLIHLRGVFGLGDDDLRAIRANVLLPIYREAVEASFADSHITPEEREGLEHLSRDLHLDEAEAELITFDEAYRAFEEAMGRGKPAGTEDREGKPE